MNGLSRKSKYPNRYTYVVKLRAEAGADALAGRVENIVTGRSHEFASGRDLLESIASDVEAGRNENSSPESDT